MDLRDYREMPDEGLFEKIERRVRLRRWTRLGGVVAAVVVLAAGAVWLLPQGVEPEVGGQRSELKVGSRTGSRKSELKVRSRRSEVGDSQSQGVKEQEVGSRKSEVGDSKTQSLTDSQSQGVKEQEVGSRRSEVGDSKTQSLTDSQSQGVKEQEVGSRRSEVGDSKTQSLTDSQTQGVEEPDAGSRRSEVGDSKSRSLEDSKTQGAKDGGAAPVQPHYDNVLWAPNIIMPMADAEENRVFRVKSTSAVSNFRMVVYSRDGRPVFSTNDIDQGWDARRDGSPVPQGTYVWIARFRDSAGSMRQEKGTVTVVR